MFFINKKSENTKKIFKKNQMISMLLIMMLVIAIVITNVPVAPSYAAETTGINTSDISKAVAYCKENPVSLSVKGDLISTDVPPVIVKDRALIPVRALFESIGADVSWNASKNQVKISTEDFDVTLSINSTKATVDGKAKSLDVPALIIEDRTMIPVRFVAEALDYDVNWENQTRTVKIDTSSSTGSSSINKTPTTSVVTPTVKPIVTPVVTPVVTPIAAGAYYVSKAGNDSNSGNEARPWKSIQKAANTAKAGDTVYIKSGTYREEIVIKNSGSANNYITFTNYPGETVIVDGTGFGRSSWGYNLIDLNAQDYVKINGINVKNSAYFGIGSSDNFSEKSYNSGSNYVTISNCSTDKTGSSGIAFHSGTGLVISNNKISHTNSTGSQEALTVCTIADFVISGNEITATEKPNGAGEGIDMKQGCKNGNVYDNYIHDMPNMGIYIDTAGIATSGINIYNNTMTNLGDAVRLCNEGINSADFGYINIYGNKITNCKRGLNIEQGEGNYPIHDISYHDNITSNVDQVAVRCLMPSSYLKNCSFN